LAEAFIIWDQGRKRYRLGDSTVFLGRDPEVCELHFDDQELSRKHALIVRANGGYVAFDFRSTNGVFVNEKPIEREVLRNGDIVRIGRQEVEFKHEVDDDNAPAAAVPVPRAGGAGFNTGGLTQILQVDSIKGIQQAAPAPAAADPQGKLASKLANLIKVSRIINQDLIRVINGETELGTLLDKIVELALEVMKADRGLVMLKNESGEFVAKAHRDMDLLIQGKPHVISQSIVKHTVMTGEPVLTEDAFADQRFSLSASIQMYNIRSAMCVPLKSRGKLLGVVYCDNRIENSCFNIDDLELLTAFGDQVAGCVDNAQLVERIQDETRMKDNLSRYLSPAIVEKIVEHKGELSLGGEKVRATILFADIRGFTSFSENKNPTIVVKFLNEFFSSMTAAIFKKGGTLDKYMGDGLMAIFGAPIALPEAPILAVEAGILMQNLMRENRERWTREYGFAGQLGIGIHSGDVVSGNIGSARRMDYTVIGDAVNLAARLQGLSKIGDIVISKDTREAIRGVELDIEEMGLVPLKGKSNEVLVYRVHVPDIRSLESNKRAESKSSPPQKSGESS